MDLPHAKCSLCDTFLYIVETPQFCSTQCLEYFNSKECIPERFQDFLRAYYSDSIALSEPAAGDLFRFSPRFDRIFLGEELDQIFSQQDAGFLEFRST